VREALSARRVYATNGPRILLHTTLNGQPMGSDMPTPGAEETLELIVLALAEQPIANIDLIRNGEIIETVVGASDGNLERFTRHIPPLGPGEYLYVRVIQIDGGAAWSSPFFGPAPTAP
jgi:hypothetical protein